MRSHLPPLLLFFIALSAAQTCAPSFAGRWVPEDQSSPLVPPAEAIVTGDLGGRAVMNLNITMSCTVSLSADWAAVAHPNAPNNYTITLSDISCGGAACSALFCEIALADGLEDAISEEVSLDPTDCNIMYDSSGEKFRRTSNQVTSTNAPTTAPATPTSPPATTSGPTPSPGPTSVCNSLSGTWKPAEIPVDLGPIELTVNGDQSGTMTAKANITAGPIQCGVSLSGFWDATLTNPNVPNNYTLTVRNVSCGGDSVCAGMICTSLSVEEEPGAESQSANISGSLAFDPLRTSNCNSFFDSDGKRWNRVTNSSSTTRPVITTSIPTSQPTTSAPTTGSPTANPTANPLESKTPAGTHATTPTEEGKKKGSMMPSILIALFAMVVVGVAVAVILYMRNRSNANNSRYSEVVSLSADEEPLEPESNL